MREIKKAIKRELRWKQFFALGLLLLGGILISGWWSGEGVLRLLGGLLFLTGVGFTYDLLRNGQLEQTPLLVLLREQPERIVWIYSVTTQRMPFGLHFGNSGLMYFKLIDGQELSLSLPEHRLRPVSESLNTYLPHVTFGYTKDREQWYMANPELLLRS